MKVFILIDVILALSLGCQANIDFVTLNARGESWIREVWATLVVGDVPNPVNGDAAIWTGIMTDQGDFLQGVTENAARSPYCNNLGKNWCTFAYTLKGHNPQVGTPAVATPGSKITTHYKLNSDTSLWDQDVYVTDKLVSHVSTSKGMHGTIFYVSVECAAGNCSPIPAHSWQDVSIVLNKADTAFGHTGDWAFKATGGKMSTADAGKTWNFTILNIPETKAR